MTDSPAALAHLAKLSIQLAGGTDAVRDRLGQQAALDLVALAAGEQAAGQLAARWSESAPDPGLRQLSTPGSEGYAGDPLHDPRVIAALGQGTGQQERQDVIAQVTAEYRQRAEGKRQQAAEDARAYANQLRAPLATPAMLPGHLVGGNRKDGARWDAVSHSFIGGQQQAADPWAQYPDHAPGALRRSGRLAPSLGGGQMPLPAEVAGPAQEHCSHGGSPDGAKFCTACGASLDGQQHDQAPAPLPPLPELPPDPLAPHLPPRYALPPEREASYWGGEAGALPLPELPPDLSEQGN